MLLFSLLLSEDRLAAGWKEEQEIALLTMENKDRKKKLKKNFKRSRLPGFP